MSGAHEIGTVSTFSVDPGDDSLLTPQDAARFLKVSVSWVYEHVRPDAQDRLPVVKLGKYLRFDARDLRAYVDAKRAESQRQSAAVVDPTCPAAVASSHQKARRATSQRRSSVARRKRFQTGSVVQARKAPQGVGRALAGGRACSRAARSDGCSGRWCSAPWRSCRRGATRRRGWTNGCGR